MAGGTGDAVEVEIKARVGDLAQVRERLLQRGAVRVGAATERDVYFAHPSRSFARTDEALRLRVVGAATELTYKGPKAEGATKTRREVTIRVDDGPSAEALLEALGFERVAEVIKRRETFRLDEATVALDEVGDLGTFAEVERTTDAGGVDAARRDVVALADELGLVERITVSYLEMLLERRGPA